MRSFVKISSLMLLILIVPIALSAGTIHVPADQPTIQAGIDAASEGDTMLAAPEQPIGRSISDFVTPDGHFDLEAARRSGYQGPLDMKGFQSAIDPATGRPVFQASGTGATANHPDDIYWSPLGSGMDNDVYALTVYDGKLIAGGWFSIAGGVAANNIASWDGFSWSSLGSGMDGRIYALTVHDNQLIAGGQFTTAGGDSCAGIASWNGSSWSPLGSGMESGFPYVLALVVWNNKLIAAGSFKIAGGISANGIASWDGSSWSSLGTGMNEPIPEVRALAVYGGALIVGGDFAGAGGVTAYGVASWDGSTWSSLGSGIDLVAYALTVYRGELIVGGVFSTAGGMPAYNVASWNGSSWESLGSGIPWPNTVVYALTIFDKRLIVGGYFSKEGCSGIASWDGNSWEPLGSGLVNGLQTWDMGALALTVRDGRLIAGGNFDFAGGQISAHVAEWTKKGLIVSQLDNTGYGTLRQAIIDANNLEGIDTITFTVSGIIALAIPLPALIDDSTVILGSTAPGGAHSVIIDGSGLTTSNGLVVQSCNNKIEGLTIRNFPGSGIEVSGPLSVNNTITNNLIYNNSGLAIDLNNDGVTANDPGDADTGPNDLLNYPEIDSVFMSEIDSSFTAYGRAADSSIIEFFISHPAKDTTRPADLSEHGEAYSYIGSDSCDNSGKFTYIIPKSAGQFSMAAATATDKLGNTSEFSQNFTLTPSPLIVVAYSPVNLRVTDPEEYYIGKDAAGNLQQTLFPATYTEIINDSVNIPHPRLGNYLIEVIGEIGAPPGATYSIGILIDGSVEAVMATKKAAPTAGMVDSIIYAVEEGWHFVNGDANRTENINILDVSYIINYLYRGGPPPDPKTAGDADCNGRINILDVSYLISYLYKGGPKPCEIE